MNAEATSGAGILVLPDPRDPDCWLVLERNNVSGTIQESITQHNGRGPDSSLISPWISGCTCRSLTDKSGFGASVNRGKFWTGL